jgi:hypothetical protein
MRSITLVLLVIVLLVSITVYADLSHHPRLYVTLSGSVENDIWGGFGRLSPKGEVIETGRIIETGDFSPAGDYSPFGITRAPDGTYWTSTASHLFRFNPKNGRIEQVYARVEQPFLNIVFAPDGRLLGWSNADGYLYEISLQDDTYTEMPLAYVGLAAGGLTEMAFAPNGVLYGADTRNKRIVTIDPVLGTVNTVVQLPWESYVGLAFAPDGTMFTSAGISRRLLQFDVNGVQLWEGGYLSYTPIIGLEFAAVPGHPQDFPAALDARTIFNGQRPGAASLYLTAPMPDFYEESGSSIGDR